MSALRALAMGLCLVLTSALTVRAETEAAREDPARRLSPTLAALLWGVVQLVPSPVLVTGSNGYGAGMRWQS
jgi:hypothetical protein